MGACKASLPWGKGHTLLTYQLEQLHLAGWQPIVVLGPHNRHLSEQAYNVGTFAAAAGWSDRPRNLYWVVNTNPSLGKTSSIRAGLAGVPRPCSVLLISAVDQPRPAWVYERLLAAYRQGRGPGKRLAKIVAPTYRGRMGHPLAFAAEVLPALKGIREESLGLRRLVRLWQSQLQAVEFESAIVLEDLNTPEAYAASLQTWSGSEASGAN